MTATPFSRAARRGALFIFLVLLISSLLFSLPVSAGDPVPEEDGMQDASDPSAGGSVPVVLHVLSPVMSARDDSQSLTPDGSLELLDDLLTCKEDGSLLPSLEFLTVRTRSGAVYYLIIDRASEEDRPNVYFLNAVDDSDLIAVLEKDSALPACTCSVRCKGDGCDRCRLDASACQGKEPAENTSPSGSAAGSEERSDRQTLLLAISGGCALLALILGLFLRSQRSKKTRRPGIYPGTRDDSFEDDEE